ncbi:MAG: carbohydrate kinase [Bacteroidaceae bacterium]|nr:carbohydrate kinase [Bacteroidaceae bacterium]MDO4994916.1 carbohydrate kinase [Bacteroidales bacterium]
MRKIIGIGETIMDIIFQQGQPTAAVPGGSVFNGVVSLARLGLPVTMLSETGNDRVGRHILDFMAQNGIDNRHVAVYQNGRSAISLAFLNERNDAEYMFYKDYPAARFEVDWPDIQADDIVMMGSYFVLNAALRPRVREFLQYARQRGALIYYDLNFRSSHRHEVVKIYADMLENLDFADIVRGSTEDLDNLFGSTDAEAVYRREISFHCRQMLSTDAGGEVSVLTPSGRLSFPVQKVETVSTIGAGDNFNAGIIYGLIRNGIRRNDLDTLDEQRWAAVVQHGIDLATEVCQTLQNSISSDWAKKYIHSL